MAGVGSGTTSFVRSIEPVSVVDRVTAEIRRSILNGALHPGQQFSLREISGQLGVSFIPVRESLRALESQGLIVTRPGKSAIVAPLSHDDLHGIYRLRRQIEPEIASRSCLLLKKDSFDRLDQYVASFADESQGIDAIYDAHHAFHYELLKPAATPWDLRTLEGLWHAGERYVRLAFGKLDDQPDEHSRREHVHGDMVAAFRSRKADRVQQAVLEHLNENEALALRSLDAVID